ncbi:MAG: oligosaccharide flippase family protein, partial [Gammaproteobacteria bacterium]|nr:oligosaccharide flippase family protein [Gemmatimonadota bacterium]NIU72895.1 oligosaccharide flippase family protein [Gammaproteobacteria bacterium]
MRPLDRAVASGVRWSAVARYGEQAVLFVTTLVLVRLLAPSAFGVFNMAFLAIGLILTLADFGIPSALIHRESVDEGFATSLFWLNMAGAALLAGVAALGAPAVGAFFDEPAAVPILRVLSLGMVLNAAGAIPAALLMRELRFERLARFQLTAAVAGGGAGIGLAATGFGVWSLVAHQLVRFGTESALLLSLGGFRPGLRPRLAHAREVAGYGLNVTGAGVLGFVLQNADNALIGRFLGSTALGYYEVGRVAVDSIPDDRGLHGRGPGPLPGAGPPPDRPGAIRSGVSARRGRHRPADVPAPARSHDPLGTLRRRGAGESVGPRHRPDHAPGA